MAHFSPIKVPPYLASGNLLHSYWKWPSRNSWFVMICPLIAWWCSIVFCKGLPGRVHNNIYKKKWGLPIPIRAIRKIPRTTNPTSSPGSRDVLRLKASRCMPRPVMQSPGPVLKDQSCRCCNLSSSAKVFSKSSSLKRAITFCRKSIHIHVYLCVYGFYVCAFVCVCILACWYVCACMDVLTYVSLCISVHITAYQCISVYICVYVCICVCSINVFIPYVLLFSHQISSEKKRIKKN